MHFSFFIFSVFILFLFIYFSRQWNAKFQHLILDRVERSNGKRKAVPYLVGNRRGGLKRVPLRKRTSGQRHRRGARISFVIKTGEKVERVCTRYVCIIGFLVVF